MIKIKQIARKGEAHPANCSPAPPCSNANPGQSPYHRRLGQRGGAGIGPISKPSPRWACMALAPSPASRRKIPATIPRVRALLPRIGPRANRGRLPGRPRRRSRRACCVCAAIVREVGAFLSSIVGVPLVVHPVMVATSDGGFCRARRWQSPARPVAAGRAGDSESGRGGSVDWERNPRAGRTHAAARIYRTSGCAALVKGGHLAGGDRAVDFLCSAEGEWMLSAPRIKDVALHGTGCAYSAAITAGLARGKKPAQSGCIRQDPYHRPHRRIAVRS